MLGGCAGPGSTDATGTVAGDSGRAGDGAAGLASTAPGAFYLDVAAAAGLDFTHRNGATGALYYPELMLGGGAVLDYDGDGLLDVFLVQSGPLPSKNDPAASDRLWRNRGDGTFEERTAAAGLGDGDYGSGAAAADYDADGDVDLYVTNLGPNRLWRNRGDGTFEDTTARAGVGDPRWSTSAAFFDYDADGDLDLYVCNYVRWSPELEKVCLGPMGLRAYCSPGEFEPERHTLFRNEGDGTFTDVSEAAGIAGQRSTGLGVVTADFDGDGRIDVYVANDQRPNFLWINRGDGTFRDEALERGCALSGLGFPEAGMGVATADPDADGDWDLFVVNLSGENATFYRNGGSGSFLDVTDELRLGAVTQPYTGFGTAFLDFDHDTALDLFIANGKVLPGDAVAVLPGGERGTAPDFDYRESNLLLRGRADGSFEDVSEQAGPSVTTPDVSRAAAFGDVDLDGDLDVLVVRNGGPVQLLRNETGSRGHWLQVRLRDQASRNRGALGAEVTIRAGGRAQRRLVQPAYSYCASNDPGAHFGLASATRADSVEVRWPSGERSTLLDVAANRIVTIERAGSAGAESRRTEHPGGQTVRSVPAL
jgi:hypothetical protein